MTRRCGVCKRLGTAHSKSMCESKKAEKRRRVRFALFNCNMSTNHRTSVRDVLKAHRKKYGY